MTRGQSSSVDLKTSGIKMTTLLACLLLFCCFLFVLQTHAAESLPDPQPADVAPRCESGEFFAYPNTKGSIYNPEFQDKREYVTITFKQSFSSIPWVSVSFSKLDVDRSENVRTNIITTNIYQAGFRAYVNQWSGTIVHEAKVSWIACNI